MKHENLFHSLINQIFNSNFSFDESGSLVDHENYCKIKDEMNKFMLNLNQSKICGSIRNQIHFLYMSLMHLENIEMEFITSNLTEEILYQQKIIEDIHSLKYMILNYIRDLSEELNN